MTSKPLKNSNRSDTSTPDPDLRSFGFSLAPMVRLTAGLLILVVLAGITGCRKRYGYRVLNDPIPVTDRWGTERHYRVFLPVSDEKMPMLVYFHGVMSEGFKDVSTLKDYTGSPVEETGLIPFCRRNRIILVVPEPAYSYGFLGHVATGWLPFEKEGPGIERIIDALAASYPVSRRHIYLCGISAGAGICHHLANRRPEVYSAILSHSQGYVDENSRLLTPSVPGPQFGLVFATTAGDYDNLILICLDSEKIYREAGYRTVLLKDLPPKSHSWSKESNRRFWRYLQAVSRPAPHSTQRSGSQP